MMKKILLSLVFSLLVFLPNFVKAEEIISFDVTAKILENASVDVSEKIKYDFGDEQKHGIFRNIPYKYKSKLGQYDLRFTNIKVTDETGQSLKFSSSKEGLDIVIKIGDKNKTISGEHTYIINYTVKKAVSFFEDSDEFYWNVTGNEWEVNMGKATANIILPINAKTEGVSAACYAGAVGEKTPCEEKKIDSSVYFSQKNLAPWNGLTVAVSLPKGMVKEPSQWQKKLAIFLDNIIIGLPLLVLAVLLFLWRKYGKDPDGQGVIVAQFDSPDNLSPLEVGVLIDERGDNKDISAEIINLVVQGYLKISAEQSTGLILHKPAFEFLQLKPAKDLKSEHDKIIMTALFGNDQENIKTEKVPLIGIQYQSKTFDEIRRVDGLVTGNLVRRGYLRSNPSLVRGIYTFIGIMVIVLGFFLTDLFISKALAALSFFISGIIIIIFSRWMPARTKKGVLAKEYILGLKKYLQVAEADRIKFHNAPEKKPEIFEKLLPYAMVLGVEKEWAKQFEGIFTNSPEWYQGPKVDHFNVMMLANNFGDFRSSLNSTVNASKSSATGSSSGTASFGGRGSGGSGFSGGGFGGGGGGSW